MPATAHGADSAQFNRFTRFGPAICLLLVLMVLAASAFAHDPGLSAAEVKLDGNKAMARLTFACEDIATIAPMNADRDGRITRQEFDAARARLESLARVSFALTIDFRHAVDAIDDKSDHVLCLALVLHVILSPRLRLVPDTHPHDEALLQFEDIFVGLIVADEKQACAP